jgi:putative oxidoreductase
MLNISIKFWCLKQNGSAVYLSPATRHGPGEEAQIMNTIATTNTPASTISGADVGATGGRLLLAAIFLLSGWSKFADPTGTIGYIQSVGLPFPQAGVAVAIAVELIGGVALIIGYRTRLVAATLAIFSLATAIFFHAALGDQNQFIHFFKNVAIAGGLLQVIAFGAGRFSLDGRSHA